MFVFPHKFDALRQILTIQKVGLDVVPIGERDRIEVQYLRGRSKRVFGGGEEGVHVLG